MGLEAEFGGFVEGVADRPGGDILTLDVELNTVDGADDTIGKIEGQLGGRVAAEVIVVLELVQVARRADNIVAGGVALDDGAGATLERALNQRLRGAVVLIREFNASE